MKLKNIFLFILLSGLLLTFTTSPGFGEEAKPVKCPRRVKVLVEKVVPGTFPEHRDLEKRILPSKDDEILNAQAGVIKKIEKTTGSDVNAGDVILTLDTTKIEKEIAEANAEIKKWKRILFKRSHWKVRSERAEKQAEKKLNESLEALKNAEAKLPFCTVTAPAAGMIGTLNANEGDHVSDGYVLGNVVDVQKVKVSLTRFADSVRNGQKIDVKIKELSQTVPGVVQKSIDGRGTHIFIDNPGKKILIGMTAVFKVLFKEHKDVVVLPVRQLLKDEGGTFVYIVDPNKKRAQKNYLKLGPKESGKVLIAEGLAAGDEIIVSEALSAKKGTLKEGLPCLTDGKKIRVVTAHPDTGKLVKRKAVKKKPAKEKAEKPVVKKRVEPKPEKPKPVEPKPVKKVKKKKPAKPMYDEGEKPKTFLNRISLGASVSYYKMSSQDFEDVYGRMAGFGLELSYMVAENVDVWFTAGISSKKKDIDWDPNPLEFEFKAFTLNLRYYLKRSKSFDFFAGAGMNLYPFEEINPIADVKDKAFGFNILAGTYYHLTKNVSVQLTLRFNMVKKALENVDNDLNMNSAELLFGLSYNL
ncbi:MAG: efflux RND transporter periplasmic adaptor subunit [bacterium]|nr:efflux RND transporter periplasmic adaptor subunit [bacterium]